MKKMLSLLLVLVLSISMVACNSNDSNTTSTTQAANNQATETATNAPAESITLQIACSASDTSPGAVTAFKVAELIQQKSGGSIKVDVYPNAQLGGDRELIESTQAGSLAMTTLTTAPMVSFIPELAVFDMPVALTDLDVAYEVVNGAFGDLIKEKYEGAGFKLLMIVPDSFRIMSSNVDIKKFEDFKGIDIRTMENKYHMAFWKNLGANPTPLAFGELYIALQQGLVKAQENPYATIVASKLYEQQKYIVNTNHIMFLSTTVMNKDVYDGLSAEHKAVIDEAFAEATEFAFAEGSRQAGVALQALKDAGLEIIDLPAAEYAKVQEAAKPVYEMIKNDIGAELVDALLKALDDAK